MSILTISLLGFSAVMAGLAYFYHKQFSGLHQLFAETTSRFEQGRLFNQNLEKKNKQLKEDLKSEKSKQEKSQKRLFQLEKSKESFSKNGSKETDSLKLNIGHLEEQVQTLTAQLQEAVHHKVEAEKKLATADVEKMQTKIDSLTSKNNSLQEKMDKNKKEFESLDVKHHQLEKKSKGIDAKEYFKTKRRCSQYNRLYNGMKGMREMADEQSANFSEAALQLSLWILKNKEISTEKLDSKTSVISTALEKINGSYLPLEETPAPDQSFMNEVKAIEENRPTS